MQLLMVSDNQLQRTASIPYSRGGYFGNTSRARANGYCAKTCALILKSASASCIRVYYEFVWLLWSLLGNEEVVMTGTGV